MKNLSLLITGFLSFSGNVLAGTEQAALQEMEPITTELIPEVLSVAQDAAEVIEAPKVKKFAGNIYNEEYWTESVYSDYVNAFWTGYNMQSYAYATTCVDNFNLFMDNFHRWYLTAVRQRSYTELWDLFFLAAGTDANETWYNCFLFQYDLRDQYARKWGSFEDFGDIYLSFIFNMLQNSLNIRSQTENMIAAYESHDTEDFIQSLGSVLRSVLDFNSYTALSSSKDAVPTAQEFMGFTQNQAVPEFSAKEREAMMQEKVSTTRARLENIKEEARDNNQKYSGKVELITPKKAFVNKLKQGNPQLQTGEGYEWTSQDYIQSPLAFVIGSLHALPSESNGPQCSSNATALRANVIEGFLFKDGADDQETSVLDAALAYYTAGSYLDEVGVLCQQSLTSTLNADYWVALFTTNEDTNINNALTAIPINLAYNAGFMWVDAINYQYYTPLTVPDNDWAFFVSYLLGDFIIRIFYHDATPQQIQQ